MRAPRASARRSTGEPGFFYGEPGYFCRSNREISSPSNQEISRDESGNPARANRDFLSRRTGKFIPGRTGKLSWVKPGNESKANWEIFLRRSGKLPKCDLGNGATPNKNTSEINQKNTFKPGQIPPTTLAQGTPEPRTGRTSQAKVA